MDSAPQDERPVSLLEGATCAHHEGRPAAITCDRCGDFACPECRAPGEAARCVRCVALVPARPRYYYTPPWRFVLQSWLSFGLYETYWFFSNWRAIRDADRSKIWPLARAIFSRFTYFSLIVDLNTQTALRDAGKVAISPVLAVGFFVFGALGRLPDPWWALSFLSVFFVVPSVARTRDLVSATEVDARSAIRPRHVVLWVLGALGWTLLTLGYAFPEDPGAGY